MAGKPFDWILVKNATAEEIKASVISYSEIARPAELTDRRVVVYRYPPDLMVVAFPETIPAYSFVNLIGWLPFKVKSITESVGFFTSPGSGLRYSLIEDTSNPHGDTAVGVVPGAESVRVYLPSGGMCVISEPVQSPPEPELKPHLLEELLAFTVTLDVNCSFGNPDFRVTDPPDTHW